MINKWLNKKDIVINKIPADNVKGSTIGNYWVLVSDIVAEKVVRVIVCEKGTTYRRDFEYTYTDTSEECMDRILFDINMCLMAE